MVETAMPITAISPEQLEANVCAIRKVLEDNRFGSEPPAKLIAVTKLADAQVTNLFRKIGIHDIAESRLQVLQKKLPEISPDFRIHWIGRLQTNKVKGIIKEVCLVQTLDRIPLAEELERRADECGRVLPCLVQVNVSGETQKGGMPPEEVLPFLKAMRQYPHIRIEGLMSIMPLSASEEDLSALFRKMRQLYERMRSEAVDGVNMNELSMGMSHDYHLAAKEGATMVRIGSALYHGSSSQI